MEDELREIGLSDNEIRVYLATLELKNASVALISSRTGLPRSTIYDTLNRLTEKGFIASYKKEKKLLYSAVDPKELLNQLKLKENFLKDLIPKLRERAGSFSKRPQVVIYEGVKGIITLLNEIYEEKELYAYGSPINVTEETKHIPKSYARKRIERSIILNLILTERSEKTEFWYTNPEVKKVTNLKFLTSLKDVRAMTFIFGDKIAIITLEKEIIGVKIDDKAIRNTQRAVFDVLWNIAKR